MSKCAGPSGRFRKSLCAAASLALLFAQSYCPPHLTPAGMWAAPRKQRCSPELLQHPATCPLQPAGARPAVQQPQQIVCALAQSWLLQYWLKYCRSLQRPTTANGTALKQKLLNNFQHCISPAAAGLPWDRADCPCLPQPLQQEQQLQHKGWQAKSQPRTPGLIRHDTYRNGQWLECRAPSGRRLLPGLAPAVECHQCHRNALCSHLSHFLLTISYV
jgi:hypothetical protein